MDWSDEGIFLIAKPLGEANAVAELFTLGHGRHLGLVRGGRSRRVRPLLQPGNLLRVTWRARLSEHLGGFNVELMEANAARILDDPAALAAVGSLAGLARLLPERDPHPELYEATLAVLRAFGDASLWPALFVRWELQLLGELGFGLDLSECAATGTDSDLVYVSPRSGRAVSRDAGKPYCDKLLKLPAFLLDETAPAGDADILAGLALTGHFLERDVLAPHGLAMPQARERLIGLFARSQQSVMPAKAGIQ
ncbi:MAG TPA: DNA repair protein RecO [Methyloceanibacter sp.]|jgi:DNA repair protein RecO (recombination protein O)|nr:DNA repair protein RecO [Methyloceanibacter sp.]